MSGDHGRFASLDLSQLEAQAHEIACLEDRKQKLERAVDLLWRMLSPLGISWVGFYLDMPRGGDEARLVLGPCRDSPACSPIGLHGACGQCLLSGRSLLVADVAQLGPNYIACDPRDRSELVIPCRDSRGTCWGVLDLDSHSADHFTPGLATVLEGFLLSAGISH